MEKSQADCQPDYRDQPPGAHARLSRGLGSPDPAAQLSHTGRRLI
jgi:hypothetical protein